jgi:hypothetical protein
MFAYAVFEKIVSLPPPFVAFEKSPATLRIWPRGHVCLTQRVLLAERVIYDAAAARVNRHNRLGKSLSPQGRCSAALNARGHCDGRRFATFAMVGRLQPIVSFGFLFGRSSRI